MALLLSAEKLELLHAVSDLVDRNGLWAEMARLGMTREFIERRENFFSRIIMELDFIEKRAPNAELETRTLKSRAAALDLKEKQLQKVPQSARVA